MLYSYNSLSFKIIAKTNSKFDLKIKEALHIHFTRKPNLNTQQKGDSMEKWTGRYDTLGPSVISFNKNLSYQKINKPNWHISLQ